MQIPVYVTNLDRRPDRWETISARLDRLGIRYERVPAVDGATLRDDGQIAAVEAACVKGHCNAMRSFLDTASPAALIIEDDVDLSPEIGTVLQDVRWWPPDARLVKLDTLQAKSRVMGRSMGETPTGRALHPVMLSQAGAAAYLVDRAAARKTLLETLSSGLPMDRLLFDLPAPLSPANCGPFKSCPPWRFRIMGTPTSREGGCQRRSADTLGASICRGSRERRGC